MTIISPVYCRELRDSKERGFGYLIPSHCEAVERIPVGGKLRHKNHSRGVLVIVIFVRDYRSTPEEFSVKLREFFLFGFCFLFLSTYVATAQIGIVDRDAKTKPTLVILGTYHMGTPGNNVVNPKVADITAPERQKQLVELVEKLKQFKPTKLVLECDLEADAKTQQAYNQYLSGSYQLSKNETNQIGFRLAKELGHKKVFCVDWSDFWDDPAINYEKFASKDPELDGYLKGRETVRCGSGQVAD